MPGYLAAVSGVDPRAVGRGVDRRVVGRSALFVAIEVGTGVVLVMGGLVLTGELFRLNIEVRSSPTATG